jgi:predicted ATP-grasp superfamily ATP-dependent carboligase
MKITVLEYLCCGGLVGLPVSTETEGSSDSQMRALLCEGLEMWNAVVLDLVACGCNVTSVIDPHVRQWIEKDDNPLTDEKVNLTDFDSAHSLEENWSQASLGADRVVVIAPEIDDILVNVIKHLRSKKFVVVAPSQHFLRVASDKWQTFQALGEHIQQPNTWLACDIDPYDSGVSPPELGFVLKPRDGAGGGGCQRVESQDQLKKAIDNLENPAQWIVQEWRDGRHCSVAMLVDEYGTCRVLGATEQLLRFDETGFHYLGARGPLAKHEIHGIENWCQQVLALIPGAFGWIGIDYIATESNDLESQEIVPTNLSRSEMYCSTRTLIEINPRLTTSYLLYRQVYGPKLSEGLIGLELDLVALRRTECDEAIEYLVNAATHQYPPDA